jgi:hypothetical protein
MTEVNEITTTTMYFSTMSPLKLTTKGLPIVIERQRLAPGVPFAMVSIQGDPVKFPMICKKEFGGWFFVDKMTLLEFRDIEKELS